MAAHYYLNTLYKSCNIKDSILANCDIGDGEEKYLEECVVFIKQSFIEIYRITNQNLVSIFQEDMFVEILHIIRIPNKIQKNEDSIILVTECGYILLISITCKKIQLLSKMKITGINRKNMYVEVDKFDNGMVNYV